MGDDVCRFQYHSYSFPNPNKYGNRKHPDAHKLYTTVSVREISENFPRIFPGGVGNIGLELGCGVGRISTNQNAVRTAPSNQNTVYTSLSNQRWSAQTQTQGSKALNRSRKYRKYVVIVRLGPAWTEGLIKHTYSSFQLRSENFLALKPTQQNIDTESETQQ